MPVVSAINMDRLTSSFLSNASFLPSEIYTMHARMDWRCSAVSPEVCFDMDMDKGGRGRV